MNEFFHFESMWLRNGCLDGYYIFWMSQWTFALIILMSSIVGFFVGLKVKKEECKNETK